MSPAPLPVVTSPTLPARLRDQNFTSVSELHQRSSGGRVRCAACAHRCVVSEGSADACGVRFNRGGELLASFGYLARRYVRAIETNTIHVLPGARSLESQAIARIGDRLRESAPDIPWHLPARKRQTA